MSVRMIGYRYRTFFDSIILNVSLEANITWTAKREEIAANIFLRPVRLWAKNDNANKTFASGTSSPYC